MRKFVKFIPLGRITILGVLLISLLVAIFCLQRRLDIKKEGVQSIVTESPLLSGRVLQIATLEYKEVVADVLWVRAVQFVAKEEKGATTDPRLLYEMIDQITDLDPQFLRPYWVAGLALSVLRDAADLSNKIIIKGMKTHPNDWHLPFLIGFNYLYYADNSIKAAQYMEMASQIEGRPDYIPLLTARLYAKGKDPQTAILFLKGVYLSTKDEKMREKITERIAEMEKEIALRNRPS